MVSQKKVLGLGVVLLLIIGALALSALLEKKKQSLMYLPIFPQYKASLVEEVILEQNGQGVHLRKMTDGKWKVSPLGGEEFLFDADTAKAVGIVDKILVMAKVRSVTTDQSTLATYDLSPEKAIRVRALTRDGATIAQFSLGKKAQNWRNTYVIVQGSQEVLEASGSISYAFKTDLAEWRNKLIPLFKQEEVTHLTVSGSTLTSPITLQVTSVGTWEVVQSDATTSAADEKSVQKLFESFENFTVADWVYNPTIDMGFNTPTLHFEAIKRDGSKILLTVGKQEETLPRYFIACSTVSEFGYIYNARVDGFIESLKPFQK